MKIQLNSDKQVTLSQELSGVVEAQVRRALERFESRLTRVEVHLSDVNSNKLGMKDKRCLLEARPAGQKPLSTDYESSTVEQAVSGAAGKMKRLLETSFGKAAHQTSRASLRTGKRAISSPRTLDELDRIEATLSELVGQSDGESPEFETHVRAATAALEKARSLVEARQENKDEPQSAKASVSMGARASTKRAAREEFLSTDAALKSRESIAQGESPGPNVELAPGFVIRGSVQEQALYPLEPCNSTTCSRSRPSLFEDV